MPGIIPEELITAFKQLRGAVFVGSGVSCAAGLPDWSELVGGLAKRLKITPDEPDGRFSNSMLVAIPQYYHNIYKRRELLRRLEEAIKLKKGASTSLHKLVSQLPTTLFYTTNFDELLEKEMSNQSIHFDIVKDEQTARHYSERTRCQLRKIHGTIQDANSVVFTREDYSQFFERRPILLDALQHDLSSKVFLFVGYSLKDPDFNSIYDKVFYRMGELHQSHFICLEGASSYEIDDMNRRGLQVIDLAQWPGHDRGEKLSKFLSELVESTSKMFHIKRFFANLKSETPVPIVITSRIHDEEKYIFYPACDIHVAHQVESDLSLIGVSSYLLPDEIALQSKEELTASHIVLVCSPFGNRFTKEILFSTQGISCGIRQKFVDSGGRRKITDGNKSFESADPLSSSELKCEYALVARYNNPWALNKYIFLFAGAHAIGTHLIGDFLREEDGYKKLCNGDDGINDLIRILEVRYKEFDPYRYSWSQDPKVLSF